MPTGYEGVRLRDLATIFDYKLNKDVAASAYSDRATYSVGDYCIDHTVLYKCNTPITTPEPWTAAHWTATDIGTEMGGKLIAIQIPYNKFQWNEVGKWFYCPMSEVNALTIGYTPVYYYAYFTNGTAISGCALSQSTNSLVVTGIIVKLMEPVTPDYEFICLAFCVKS